MTCYAPKSSMIRELTATADDRRILTVHRLYNPQKPVKKIDPNLATMRDAHRRGDMATVRDLLETHPELEKILGELVKSVVLKARADGVFAALPKALAASWASSTLAALTAGRCTKSGGRTISSNHDVAANRAGIPAFRSIMSLWPARRRNGGVRRRGMTRPVNRAVRSSRGCLAGWLQPIRSGSGRRSGRWFTWTRLELPGVGPLLL